ncbi:GGDEF domain-containing protein [Marinobacter sp. CA1]|uniref:GGDEF domain-containing protein n=1 Tax=Marinobacter sp. CA1 TaxID=2817656 RepID=UPI001D08803B|nr:GGDEF domain-containing protein [Marinobacter sp. CA1]
MSSAESWKAKYLREIEEAEVREQRWQEERHTLGRMLVRTSLASEGQGPHLDSLLGQLRDLLRKDHYDLERLRQLQASIDRQLTQLDDRKQQTFGQLKERVDALVETARRHPQFQPEKDGLRRLEKAFRKPDQLRETLPQWFCELAELVARALAADPATEHKPGLLGRWFGNGDEHHDETPELAAPLELSDEDLAQRLRIARRISELLGQMLAQLALDPHAHARAETLRDHLAVSNDWAELRASLNEVADLLIAAVRRGQQEFEAFLKRLDERLLALQDHFLDQSDMLAGAQTASQAFDRGLREGLEELGQRVKASEDVHELKRSVNDHIETISVVVARYREEESERERRLASQVATMQEKLAALEAHSEQMQERLREERSRALTDVLTQLPNREAWQERLAFEFKRWQRYRHSLTVVMLDIDHFKRINDSYGHKAGDRVIQLLGKTLSERLRSTDFVARYGGEEFVVLMPETDNDGASRVVESLREHIAQLPFHFRGEPVSITFSAGVAQLRDGDDQDSVFDRADKALYQAKDGGRNRVQVAG